MHSSGNLLLCCRLHHPHPLPVLTKEVRASPAMEGTSAEKSADLRAAFLEEYGVMRKMAADASSIVRATAAGSSSSSHNDTAFDGLDGTVIMCMYDELVRLRKRVAVYEGVLGEVESAVRAESGKQSQK